MQNYLNEAFYRFNRRSFRKSNFQKLIVTMIQNKTTIYKTIHDLKA